MTAPSRFLAWLLLPALVSCSFNLLAATAEGAPQALHLLDYIGADYPPTVEAGKVVDDSEYREQVEFLGVLQGLVAELPDKPERASLVKGVDELLAAVTNRQDGNAVARQARQLGAQLAAAYEVSQAPAITPDPTRGAPLYAQHCSVCHGDGGAGEQFSLRIRLPFHNVRWQAGLPCAARLRTPRIQIPGPGDGGAERRVLQPNRSAWRGAGASSRRRRAGSSSRWRG